MLITEAGKSLYNALFIVEYFLRELHKENYLKETCRSASFFTKLFNQASRGFWEKHVLWDESVFAKCIFPFPDLLSLRTVLISVLLFPTVLIVSSFLRPESNIDHHHRPNFHHHRPTLQLHRPKIQFHRLKFSNWNLVSSRLWNNHYHFWAFWSVENE